MAGASTIRRLQWAVVALAVISFAVWYGPLKRDRKVTEVTEVAEVQQDSPAEPPARLQVKRVFDDPAVEAQLPEPCPLTTVEYRYGSLMTNVLVERFDDGSASRGMVVGRRRITVNTDGAPNSYHSRVIKADDAAVGALNIICNAQAKIFKKVGESKNLLACRQGGDSVTDEFAAAFEELRNKNWEDTASGYSILFDWNVLGRGKQIRPDGPYSPCIKGDGFFVAKTKLRLRPSQDDCDASIYPDSRATSAFVLPINWFADYQKRAETNPERFGNFRSGDVVVAYRPPGTNRSPVWAYGVVGDAGPFNKLGEASIGFLRQIRQSNVEIKTYRAALNLDTDALRPREIDFVVFEGSASELKRDYSPANIRKIGEQRFAAWMNGALDKAQARFLACAKRLELLPRPQPPPPS
jgi:hypothetical protein